METIQKHSNQPSDFRQKIDKIFHWFIVVVPFILLLLPKTYFDEGESVCLSKSLASIECYACGLTRGVMHFIHLDFEVAWNYNKLTFIVIPLLFLYWIRSLFIILNKKPPRFLDKIM